MIAVINRKRYNTDTAEHIADNEFRDQANRLQRGMGCRLYRTPKGAYFFHHETQWIGSQDSIEPIPVDEAYGFYETAYNQHVDFEEAFPNVEIQDA